MVKKVCTNPAYVHATTGKCAFGQFTFDGESCPCDQASQDFWRALLESETVHCCSIAQRFGLMILILFRSSALHISRQEVECGCVTRSRATEGLERKKTHLTILGACLLPAAGLVALLTLWCLRTNHPCGQCCRADQARKEAGCARCAGPAVARGCTLFGYVSTPLFMFVAGVVLLVMAGGVDVDNGFWEGCP